MKKLVKITLTFFVIIYILFGAFLTLYQENFIYYPDMQDFTTCNSFINAEKVNYKGTRMYVRDIKKPTIILYHGNAGSACDRSFYADIFTQAGYGYIIVEYTGYSNDSQKPSHNSIKKNVQDVVAFVKEKNIQNVNVVGESIGTGVASYHTSLQAPNKLLLISPFTNLVDIAKRQFGFYPTNILVENAFDNKKFLSQYKNPVTIIHGNKDMVIPYDLAKELFESLETKKEFVKIDGAGHNNLFSYPETYAVFADFLKQN